MKSYSHVIIKALLILFITFNVSACRGRPAVVEEPKEALENGPLVSINFKDDTLLNYLIKWDQCITVKDASKPKETKKRDPVINENNKSQFRLDLAIHHGNTDSVRIRSWAAIKPKPKGSDWKNKIGLSLVPYLVNKKTHKRYPLLPYYTTPDVTDFGAYYWSCEEDTGGKIASYPDLYPSLTISNLKNGQQDLLKEKLDNNNDFEKWFLENPKDPGFSFKTRQSDKETPYLQLHSGDIRVESFRDLVQPFANEHLTFKLLSNLNDCYRIQAEGFLSRPKEICPEKYTAYVIFPSEIVKEFPSNPRDRVKELVRINGKDAKCKLQDAVVADVDNRKYEFSCEKPISKVEIEGFAPIYDINRSGRGEVYIDIKNQRYLYKFRIEGLEGIRRYEHTNIRSISIGRVVTLEIPWEERTNAIQFKAINETEGLVPDCDILRRPKFDYSLNGSVDEIKQPCRTVDFTWRSEWDLDTQKMTDQCLEPTKKDSPAYWRMRCFVNRERKNQAEIVLKPGWSPINLADYRGTDLKKVSLMDVLRPELPIDFSDPWLSCTDSSKSTPCYRISNLRLCGEKPVDLGGAAKPSSIKTPTLRQANCEEAKPLPTEVSISFEKDRGTGDCYTDKPVVDIDLSTKSRRLSDTHSDSFLKTVSISIFEDAAFKGKKRLIQIRLYDTKNNCNENKIATSEFPYIPGPLPGVISQCDAQWARLIENNMPVSSCAEPEPNSKDSIHYVFKFRPLLQPGKRTWIVIAPTSGLLNAGFNINKAIFETFQKFKQDRPSKPFTLVILDAVTRNAQMYNSEEMLEYPEYSQGTELSIRKITEINYDKEGLSPTSDFEIVENIRKRSKQEFDHLIYVGDSPATTEELSVAAKAAVFDWGKNVKVSVVTTGNCVFWTEKNVIQSAEEDCQILEGDIKQLVSRTIMTSLR